MQLVQFVTWSIHASTPLFMDCNYPKVYVAFLLFLGAFFFTLFTNFYIQSYVKKPAGEKSKNQWKKHYICNSFMWSYYIYLLPDLEMFLFDPQPHQWFS